jgi:serine/threonine protein kinase
MELCEGENYLVILFKKKHSLNEDEFTYFFFILINGLEYILSLGIVHWDLKPEILLLSSDNIFKIIEFNSRNYFKENKEPLFVTPCG